MEAFAMYVIGLPEELKAAIAIGVLALVRVLLAGRVPDAFVTELAAVITTALITVIELALGLIPVEFEPVAAAILRLIAVLLGTILVARAYLVARASAQARGFRF
jgi:hypothetical protein